MTRLTALELVGFKSFADRTRFEFPAGITAVVGPNGSGKSNVVDAVKWVLGEQSVRSLRGRDMTDVIFAGSGGRKPLGVAEVSLIFDNAASLLPVDTPQVQITRRVYRSGENEYLINGEISRLRDIRELFLGTGAATEAYSVIEQGRVDALLVASGRDRRAVFEEAAGITRFRARRTEALRRLERSEQNRQRLADIVGEVSTRLETVRHQAARARRWQQMTDRLRSLRLAAAARDLAEVDASVSGVERMLQEARDGLAAEEARSLAKTDAVAALDDEDSRLQPTIAAARVALAADRARAAAAEATATALTARRGDLVAEHRRLEQDVQRAVAARIAAVAAIAAAEAETLGIESEVSRIADRLAASERAVAGSHEHASRARLAVAERAAAVEEGIRIRNRLESELERAADRLDNARRGVEAIRTKADAARQQLARLEEADAAWQGVFESLARNVAAADQEIETLDVTRRERAAAVVTGWQTLAGWQAKLEACRERRTTLEELTGRQDGFSDAARRLLASPDASIPGLLGPLGTLIDADVTWAPLVDLVLGPLGQAVVAGPLEDLVGWQSTWSDTDAARAVLDAGGRVGLLALDAIPAPGSFSADGVSGVVGRLDRLAGLAASGPTGAAADLVGRLLGRVWVVERLSAALPLLPTAPRGTLFVSRAGECLSAEGSLELGQPSVAAGLVARRSELRALAAREDELVGTVAAASARIERLQADLAETGEDIRRAQERRQDAAERSASSRTERDRTSRDLEAARVAVEDHAAEFVAAERYVLELSGARDTARVSLEHADERLAEARRSLEDVQSDVDTLDRSRVEVLEQIQSLRIAQAAGDERLGRARDAAAARAADHEARRRDLEAHLRDRDALEQRLAALDMDLLTTGATRAETALAAERSAATLGELDLRADRLATDRRAATTALEEARERAARLSETIHAHELEAGEARHRRTRIVERIRDDYDLSIEDLVARSHESASDVVAAGCAPAETGVPPEPAVPADRAELEAEIETLRRKLGSMTSVNLEALAEAEALSQRLAGLQAQLDDVTNAKQAIEQLVARIDDESRRLLGETIETVRGHFRELFERVFGGGQADIVVEDGVDLLEAAVEIVARPPGKEPRNISLLSGGEKTMTCVALLLAIFRSRPSPFCVLDEVDAALDEANVDRFAGVLRDFLSSTQFIVVTHSKKTMAAADTLYGVTMEESGVSKRIAVRFEAAAAAANSARRAA